MISKQQVKFVKSLKLKKYRKKAESFIVEGAKNVIELLNSEFEIKQLFVTEKFLQDFHMHIPSDRDVTLCSEKELAEMGTFQTNEYALAVAAQRPPNSDFDSEEILLALDDVSDPGNLGTIIRIADWYGIATILASEDTADFYNPKVINASMGSFTRVSVRYLDLEDYFETQQMRQVYGAFLDGENVHKVNFLKPAVLLMGNESKGIDGRFEKFVNHKITIPRLGGAESLNVAISTAVICDNLFRF
jgi:RNA methyltransferase, TrmH family